MSDDAQQAILYLSLACTIVFDRPTVRVLGNIIQQYLKATNSFFTLIFTDRYFECHKSKKKNNQ